MRKPQSPRTVRVTIARNTTFNAMGRVFEGVIGLVLTPYILSHLDIEVWGLWSLVAVLTGYAALLDFGVASGFVKYLAQHTTKGDQRAFSAVVSTGFFFYAAFGVVVVVVGWAAIDLILDVVVPLFRPLAAQNVALMAELRYLFRGALILFAVNNCLAPFAAVPTGMQRMGISNVCGAGASVMKAVATAVFLEAGFGVRGLLYANATVLAVLAVVTVAVAFWLQPGLRVGPRHVHRETFRDLFGFGWKTQVAKLSNLINFQTDRIVIAWYAGLEAAGIYRLGEELALKIRQLPALLVSALIPAVSDLQTRDRQAQLQELYLRSTKYLAVVSVPMALFLFGAAGMAMRAWLGERDELDTAVWVLRILVLGHLVNLIPGGGISVALGMGRPGMAMKAGLISMGSNLVLTIALVLTFGFYGVPIATSLALFISAAWFFYAMRAVLDVPLRRLAREALLWPVLACLPGLAATLAMETWAQGYTGRLPNLLAGGAAGACFGMSYLLLLYYLPFLDRFDADFLGRTLRLGRLPGFAWVTRRARDSRRA